ncbi:MAG TPA: energy transducer TonB [Rhodothermales bacterium]
MKSTESTPRRSPSGMSHQFGTNGHHSEHRPETEVPAKLKHRIRSVVPRKVGRADLRRFETILVETGLVVSLGVLLGVLKMPLEFESEFIAPEAESVVVQIEEVEQTEQIKRPPPPPRPPVPVTVPDDTILEDEPLDIDAEIDIEAPLELPDLPPPPKQQEQEDESEIFIVVEEMPELIGGIASLYAVIEYPDLALRAGIEGTVVVQIVIEVDGAPTNPQIMKSGGSILDTAALDAIKKLRFKPGKQRGKPVRVRYAMPVRFKLTDAQNRS